MVSSYRLGTAEPSLILQIGMHGCGIIYHVCRTIVGCIPTMSCRNGIFCCSDGIFVRCASHGAIGQSATQLSSVAWPSSMNATTGKEPDSLCFIPFNFYFHFYFISVHSPTSTLLLYLLFLLHQHLPIYRMCVSQVLT